MPASSYTLPFVGFLLPARRQPKRLPTDCLAGDTRVGRSTACVPANPGELALVSAGGKPPGFCQRARGNASRPPFDRGRL